MGKMTAQKYYLYATLIQLLIKTTISFHFPLFPLPFHPTKKGYSLTIILGLNMQTFLLTLRGFCPETSLQFRQNKLQHSAI